MVLLIYKEALKRIKLFLMKCVREVKYRDELKTGWVVQFVNDWWNIKGCILIWARWKKVLGLGYKEYYSFMRTKFYFEFMGTNPKTRDAWASNFSVISVRKLQSVASGSFHLTQTCQI